ncbi:MAG: mono/diheme cytochrome c family protein [Flavobacteriales bacterium]|jgi:mono/diheme cytochrome c family protein
MKLMLKRSFSPIKNILVTGLLLIAIGSTNGVQAQDGEKLFKGNCASCHRPTEEVLTGPGLKGVMARWKGRETLIYEWVRNPQGVIDGGDSYVKNLVAEYASAGIMSPQAVTNEEIDAIFAYVEAYVPPKKAIVEQVSANSEGSSSDPTTWLLVILGVFLIIIFSVAGTRRSLSEVLNEKKGEESDTNFTYVDTIKQWIGKNKMITTVIVIILLVMGAVDTWDRLSSIGIYEGYQPEQPIAFSHKVHAGQNQINCVYCHSGVENSKNAGIPSVNICMNCHKAIAEGPNTGKTEIAKIYAAIGFDPETKTYIDGYEQKPVKWVKVHNLPDHVFFSHEQHTTVGQVECETCHGEVKELTVGKQNKPLTMGWCIDCHNKTEVQMADNGYYDEIHARLSTKELKKYLKDEKITVKDLGGWECSKCHY